MALKVLSILHIHDHNNSCLYIITYQLQKINNMCIHIHLTSSCRTLLSLLPLGQNGLISPLMDTVVQVKLSLMLCVVLSNYSMFFFHTERHYADLLNQWLLWTDLAICSFSLTLVPNDIIFFLWDMKIAHHFCSWPW